MVDLHSLELLISVGKSAEETLLADLQISVADSVGKTVTVDLQTFVGEWSEGMLFVELMIAEDY
jgi:hypothetical protein